MTIGEIRSLIAANGDKTLGEMSEVKSTRIVIDLPEGWELRAVGVQRRGKRGVYSADLLCYVDPDTGERDKFANGYVKAAGQDLEMIGTVTRESLSEAIADCALHESIADAREYIKAATAGAVGVDADGREVEL